MNSGSTTRIWNVLRIGAALCFIGHGAFGLLRKEAWLPFFAIFGIGAEAAHYLMPLVGGIDIALGIMALVSPRPVVFAYMAVWAVWTAALRPLSGDSFAELTERAGNYGVPMVLLLMALPRPSVRAWLARIHAEDLPTLDTRRVTQLLVATTTLLLAGHGFIGLAGSPLLAAHYQSVGLSASLVPTIGALEISAALALALRPSVSLALVICGWKLASESLFLAAGAPMWEVIERGGSYAAPLALAMVLGAQRRSAPVARRAAVGVIATVLAALLPAGLEGQQRASDGAGRAPAEQEGAVDAPTERELLAELRRGGVVLACRHAITDHDASDRNGSNYADRSLQRNLNAEGEAQARRMGEAIGTLRLPVSEVLTSPMARTKETAEMMFGRATVSRLLRMTPDSAATRALFTDVVERGAIRVLMTHTGVLMRRLAGTPFRQVPEGGCVLLRPDGGTKPRPAALITEKEWEAMRRVAQ